MQPVVLQFSSGEGLGLSLFLSSSLPFDPKGNRDPVWACCTSHLKERSSVKEKRDLEMLSLG